MCEGNAIKIANLGKMYKLYKNPSDKYRDAFGLNRFKKDYYREFWALRDISLVIKKGERIGLIGHNGAGKSTLLKTIIGRIEPTEGTVEINGAVQALLELGTGFHPEFTGRENIKASLMLSGCTYKQIDDMMDEIIDFAELEDYIEQPVKTYSAGMYARLAFSTATAIKPELLVIDEVLGAGDAYFAGKCVERMRSLTKESGATVLFVSHDLASVQAICDRVIWIDKGRVRYDGDTLTALKLYSKSVRENDELRLKIKDLKISKKQAVLLDRDQDLYNTALFRLVPKDTQSYRGKAKIRKVALCNGDDELAAIQIGEPMDNDETATSLIFDDPEFMCWGPSQKDKVGYYRTYLKEGGRYHHAPFQLKYSKQYDTINNLQLMITAEIKQGNTLLVEYLTSENCYVTCGEIDETQESFVFELHDNSASDTSTESQVVNEQEGETDAQELLLPKQKLDYRDTQACSIVTAAIFSNNGQARKVFAFEEPIERFHFGIQFKEPRNHFVFALFIYSARGDIAFNICEHVTLQAETTEATVDISLGQTRIGTGEYVLTFAIYDELNVMDNSVEAPVMAIIDRAMAFKIEQPLHYMANMGMVLPHLDVDVRTNGKGDFICNSLL